MYWALACYRLLGLIINLRLKARLYCVHLTYTLVPTLLLLLRIALLAYDADGTVPDQPERTLALALTNRSPNPN